jgi:hypothetical protein
MSLLRLRNRQEEGFRVLQHFTAKELLQFLTILLRWPRRDDRIPQEEPVERVYLVSFGHP